MSATFDIGDWTSEADIPLDTLLECAVALLCMTRLDQQSLVKLAQLKGEAAELLAFNEVTARVEPAFAVLYQSGSQTLALIVRGTTNAVQWLPHVAGVWSQGWPDGASPPERYVHMGMHRGASVCWPVLERLLDSGLPLKRVVLVGHSYGGGACAVVQAYLALRPTPPRVEVLTFGAPRVFTGAPRTFPGVGPYWRLQHGGDIVTAAPPTWLNIRGQLAGQGLTRAVAAVAGSPLAAFVAGKLGGTYAPIGAWKHWGRGLELQRDGSLKIDDPPFAEAGRSTQGTTQVGVGIDHIMDSSYWPSLRRRAQPASAQTAGVRRLLALASAVLAQPVAASTEPDWDTFDHQMEAVARATYSLPSSAGVAELRGSEGVELSIAPRTVDAPSIGASSGSSAMAIWKYTAYIYWGDLSRSVSIHKTGPPDIPSAKEDARLWVRQYKALFGNTVTGPNLVGEFYVGAPGAPVIQWYRVSDPLTPRLSQRFRTKGTDGAPYVAGGSTNSAADVPWVGLSMSMMAAAGGRFTKDVVSILGQPDKVIDEGGYKPNVMALNGVTFRTALNKYLAYILPPKGIGFGTMGRDFTNAPDFPITNFASNADGMTRITAVLANWVDAEYIRITRSGVPYYNREWRVRLNDDDTYSLLGSRPAQAALPASATGYRARLASGIKVQTFYSYNEAVGSFDPDDRVFPAKRNPARAYAPLASRRRRRTPAK